MMHILRRIAALAFGIALCAAMTPVWAQSLPQLHIATAPNDGGAEVYYALDMGFFKDAGLDVDITTLSNGAIIASGLAAGTFDIGSTAISYSAAAHERGLPFVIIAPAAVSSSDRVFTTLVVAKNSTFAAAKDLNGKTIAVNALQSVNHVAPQAWLDQNGADLSTIKFVEIPFSQMPEALAAHRVDAAIIAEPALDEAVKGGERIVAAPFNAIAPRFLFLSWSSTSTWADAHPDLVKKFAAVIGRTARWANANPSLSARILEKYTKLPVAPTMVRVLYPEHADPREAQPFIDAAARYKVIKQSFPARELFARSYQ
jgi:ABC-type nitrate/sulfonate/bicarbonate transport system substrate-binding protein